MLARVLEIEREEFLGRLSYQRGAEFRGYRNGSAPERTVGTGMGAVAIRQPRVSDVPADAAPFASEIVGRDERRSETQARLLARLYLEGLASGDFEPVFRELVGGTAALSPSSILRLKQEWADEYQLWRCRPLTERCVYLFADGLYLRAGLEGEKTAVLIVIGVTADGRKELLAMEEGYRESTVSWATVLRGLRDRGLQEAPLLAIGDGALGLWAGLDQVFPSTRHQRCWNHRLLNVLDKLPRRLHSETSKQLHALYTAPTRVECTRLRASCVSGCGCKVKLMPPPAWSATGRTSSPSTTSPRSIGRTCVPATRSRASSPGFGCAPTPPSPCGYARTRSTWSSSW
jgi:putative transposase